MADCIYINNKIKCDNKAITSGLCKNHIYFYRDYNPYKIDFYSIKEFKYYVHYNFYIITKFIHILKKILMTDKFMIARNYVQFISNSLVERMIQYMIIKGITRVKSIKDEIYINYLIEMRVIE